MVNICNFEEDLLQLRLEFMKNKKYKFFSYLETKVRTRILNYGNTKEISLYWTNNKER